MGKVKIRAMGTPNDLKWLQKILHRHKQIKILEESDRYPNKGTNKYFRQFFEIEKEEEE